jgi:hypothetical protein
MDGGEELSAETLDTYLGLPEQKMIGAWMVKGPEALKGYGTRAANGVLSIRVHHALQRLAAELLLADERIILVGAAIGLVSDVPFRLEATHHRR